MAIVYFETIDSMNSSYQQGDIIYTLEKGLYDIWLIGNGGSGGQASSGWGLYRGAGGTAGAYPGIARVIFYNPLSDGMARVRYQGTNRIDIYGKELSDISLNESWGLVFVSNGPNGNRGQNAGAFRPTPSKADPPIGGSVSQSFGTQSIKSNRLHYILYHFTMENNGDRTEGSAVTALDLSGLGPNAGKWLTPQYLAGAGQNAYSDTDPSDGTLCLGQPGGGQGVDDADVGYGGPGGLVIEKIEESIACEIYKGNELINGVRLGNTSITPYVYI